MLNIDKIQLIDFMPYKFEHIFEIKIKRYEHIISF